MTLGRIHVGVQDNNAVDKTLIWIDAVGDDRIIDL